MGIVGLILHISQRAVMWQFLRMFRLGSDRWITVVLFQLHAKDCSSDPAFLQRFSIPLKRLSDGAAQQSRQSLGPRKPLPGQNPGNLALNRFRGEIVGLSHPTVTRHEISCQLDSYKAVA